jgi:cation:H+ antiporter
VANLALVGGVIAILRPLHVGKLTIRREIPVMLGVEILLWPMFTGGHFPTYRAILLLGIFAGLIAATAWAARREGDRSRLEAETVGSIKHVSHSLGMCIFLVFVGLLGLSLGAKMTVEGAIYVGEKIGLSKAVIGLTIIAFGTSLPELVTCVVAALKGQHDISVGNLVGSNIFNALLVVGGAGVVRSFDVSPRFAGGADFWIMIGVSAGFAGLAIVGRRIIGRLGGVILVCTYGAYIGYLVMHRSAAR